MRSLPMNYASESYAFGSYVDENKKLSIEKVFCYFWENISTHDSLLSCTASLNNSHKGAAMYNNVVVYYKHQF